MLEHKENLFEGWGQIFSVKEVVFKKKTEHQDLVIFDSATFGRVMALDGVIQTTEQDELVYHEMLAHVSILAHGNVRHMLVIGGGDGAMLREVLKHAGVAEVTHVEIDRDVIDICERYLPHHSNGAFHDERVKQVIADGVLSERYAHAELSTRYYTPEIHQGAFALPRFLIDAIEG